MKDINLRKIFLNTIARRRRLPVREVRVGEVPLGGGHPVRLQSMATTPTLDTAACVEEGIRIIRAGAEYLRFTAQNVAEAENLANIRDALRRRGYRTPLIADVHFNPSVAETAARIVEKVRINPGNFVRFPEELSSLPPQRRDEAVRDTIRTRLVPLLHLCKAHGTALRIGVNHGSLAPRIVETYGDTPQGMVTSAMEYLRICKEEDFHQVVLSMKSSNARVMVQAYRLLVAAMAAEGDLYPLHLGITEAGEGDEGRIRSATGMGALLAEGIGDTLRVSLTEPSENEIPVGKKLLHHLSSLRDGSMTPPFPPSFDPFEYHAPALAGLPGITRTPAVVAARERGDRAARQPDLWWEKERGRLVVAASGEEVPFLVIHPGDSELPTPAAARDKVLVAEAREGEGANALMSLLARLEAHHLHNPVIFKKHYDTPDREAFLVAAAADMGPLFLDGYGQGIWLDHPRFPVSDIAFMILQAARVRTTRPEYISCPSCGRTLFNIREVTARIRARTSHLTGVKIAIMGCIVNGPGEMADADYGYVGSGKDRVTLYHRREVVKRNIPADRAVEELIKLIKEKGDWKDPER